ncbi:hypothetical protein [Sphingosinicella soli]|uniref:ElaB/YqjD/DUF883 family membrane-anchored ribosome-binding protein n=1 Tax=Sphingosinicella soli TaxID=333708 RepID=A0A7W7AY45_9SPHN|nr:hypothetical protein [Sphingosinicella soli]MBB4630520.1 ElaB/YqjD/DUF883 family membrane-anchored ribosome-binding protein [Sphingosinicella soli]
MSDIVPTPVAADPAPLKQDRLASIKAEAGKLKSEASTKARSAAEEGKTRAAETLGSVSHATREAADKLKGTQAEPLANIINSAADSVESFAQRMREKSVDDIIDDTREMVRRSPVLVIAAAAAAGFIISRFFKASRSNDNEA